MLYDLTEITPGMAPLVGGKAAALGALARAGLPVPRGVVIPPDVDEDLEALVDEAYQRVGATRLAVRSSTTAEDMAGAAAAGQFKSYLHVERAGLMQAVQACRSSLWSSTASAYRQRRGNPEEWLAMAVVLQAMVEAEVAGVMFTAHPVTGRRDQAVIEAVVGTAEALVNGQATPDHWEVDTATDTVILAEAPQALLTPPQIFALVALGRRVEELRGSAQDIEWALTGTRFHLLQARPITTL